ncbi:DAK1 DegV-like protein [Suillus placidus]|uniref:DAK1 DegV-like protein n=1 Tax=Suillus placidus TaxID=48579 RepID=A0A9P7A463_9AGAM|nr:DAK1 DegV-like protein [Suillus placidus]
MSHRHIYDFSDGLVRKSLRGAVALSPALRLQAFMHTLYVVTSSPSPRIAVLSSGGAGYKPAPVGYKLRNVHPPSLVTGSQVRVQNKFWPTIELTAFANGPTHRDLVVIISNYTGDRLDFGLAIEMLARNIRDRSKMGMTWRWPFREVSGKTFVCKLLCASSPTISPAKYLSDALVAHFRSIGVALGHCRSSGREPHAGLSLGIICVRRAPLESSRWLATKMLRLVRVSTFDAHEPWLREDDVTVLFMNNLGGVSQLEIGALVEEFGFLVGNNEDDKVVLLALLDAPSDAYSRLCKMKRRRRPCCRPSSPSGIFQSSSDGGLTWQGLGMLKGKVNKGIRGACQAVLVPEPDMTRFDMIMCDGDYGETFAGGATRRFNAAILAALDSGTFDPAKTDPAALVSKVGEILEGSIDGTADASLEDAVMAVKEGAEKTRGMKARLGRAPVCVSPDPGAWGVAYIVVGFEKGMAM